MDVLILVYLQNKYSSLFYFIMNTLKPVNMFGSQVYHFATENNLILILILKILLIGLIILQY